MPWTKPSSSEINHTFSPLLTERFLWLNFVLCVTLTWLIPPQKKVLSKQNLWKTWFICDLSALRALSPVDDVCLFLFMFWEEWKSCVKLIIWSLVWPFAGKKRQGLFCVKISNSMISQKKKKGIYISREIWLYWEVFEGLWVCEKKSCWIVIKHLGFLDWVSEDKQIIYWEYKLSCLLNVYENVIYWPHKVRLKISKFHCITKKMKINK